jgi:hypothetical protein
MIYHHSFPELQMLFILFKVKRKNSLFDYLVNDGIRNEFQVLIRFLLYVSIDVIACMYIFMFPLEISIEFIAI